MRVVDTSAWIEWMLGSPLGQSVEVELPPNGEWVVPTIIQYELARWMAREVPDVVAAATIAFSTQLVVRPLDTELATKAALHSQQHKLAMADSIIYATAMDSGADLLTCDAHFADLPNVVYLAKHPQ
jgi:predicted nucleic acid-binding protein